MVAAQREMDQQLHGDFNAFDHFNSHSEFLEEDDNRIETRETIGSVTLTGKQLWHFLGFPESQTSWFSIIGTHDHKKEDEKARMNLEQPMPVFSFQRPPSMRKQMPKVITKSKSIAFAPRGRRVKFPTTDDTDKARELSKNHMYIGKHLKDLYAPKIKATSYLDGEGDTKGELKLRGGLAGPAFVRARDKDLKEYRLDIVRYQFNKTMMSFL